MPWRDADLPKSVRFGVMWDDGVVPLSPPCKRALQAVVDSLRANGHEIFDLCVSSLPRLVNTSPTSLCLSSPPDPFEGFLIGAQLLLADGSSYLFFTILSMRS